MNNLVSKTYRDIIDEVCAKVRTEFIEGSVSECVGKAGGDWDALHWVAHMQTHVLFIDRDVLEELRGLWEAKAIEAGIVDTEYPEEYA